MIAITLTEHTSFKEIQLHKLVRPELLQPNDNQVNPVSLHSRPEGVQVLRPQPTHDSSKPPHEVKNSWLVSPQRLQGNVLQRNK